MKKVIVAVTLVLVSIFIITGCGGPKVDTGAIVNHLNESHKKLVSVQEEGSLVVYQKVGGVETEKKQEFRSQMVYGADHSLERLRSKIINDGKIFESIIVPTGVYNNSGQGWVQYSTDKINLGSTYASLYNTFLQIMPKTTVKEEGDTYVFTFKGKDADLYKAIAPNFNMNIEGTSEDNFDLEVSYIIDKSNYYLKEVNQQASVTVGSDVVRVTSKAVFSNFNGSFEILEPAAVATEVAPAEGAPPQPESQAAPNPEATPPSEETQESQRAPEEPAPTPPSE